MKMLRPVRLCCFASVALVAAATIASPAELTLQSGYESWEWEDETLVQLATRAKASWRLTAGLDLSLSTGYFSTTSEETADLRGWENVRGALSYRPFATLALGVSVEGPTGKRNLETSETSAEIRLANRLLALQTHRLGDGGRIDLSAAFSHRLGPATVGVGAGWLYRGAYEPYSTSEEYRPGNAVTVAGGVEVGGTRWLVRADARTLIHQEDELAGSAVYQTGSSLEVEALVLRRWDRVSLWTSVRHLRFGDSGYLVERESMLEDQILGNETYLSGGVHWSFPVGVRLDGSVQQRVFGGHTDDLERATSTDVRGQVSVRMARHTWLELRTRQSFAVLEGASKQLDAEEGTELRGSRYTLGVRTHF